MQRNLPDLDGYWDIVEEVLTGGPRGQLPRSFGGCTFMDSTELAVYGPPA
jgi:hypothetical protein